MRESLKNLQRSLNDYFRLYYLLSWETWIIMKCDLRASKTLVTGSEECVVEVQQLALAMLSNE